MSHQPVSVNPCKRLGLMLLCCIYCSSMSWFSQRSSEHLKRVQYMQSISVIKLFGVHGYRAINPQAAWICRVSERVVISRYIFCTACIILLSFFLSVFKQRNTRQSMIKMSVIEELLKIGHTHVPLYTINASFICSSWCQMTCFIQSALKYSEYS